MHNVPRYQNKFYTNHAVNVGVNINSIDIKNIIFHIDFSFLSLSNSRQKLWQVWI